VTPTNKWELACKEAPVGASFSCKIKNAYIYWRTYAKQKVLTFFGNFCYNENVKLSMERKGIFYED